MANRDSLYPTTFSLDITGLCLDDDSDLDLGVENTGSITSVEGERQRQTQKTRNDHCSCKLSDHGHSMCQICDWDLSDSEVELKPCNHVSAKVPRDDAENIHNITKKSVVKDVEEGDGDDEHDGNTIERKILSGHGAHTDPSRISKEEEKKICDDEKNALKTKVSSQKSRIAKYGPLAVGGIVMATGVGGVATVGALSLAGFTSSGVAAGSLAAAMQSAAYGAATSGLFAKATSVGMAGLGIGTKLVVNAGASSLAWWGSKKYFKKNGDGKEESENCSADAKTENDSTTENSGKGSKL